jgi:MFS family permease
MEKFEMSIEQSSIFFIIHVFSYFIVLTYINKITSRYGLKLTISFGLICNVIGSILLPPIHFLPQSYLLVFLGLLILGIPGALINVAGVCDLMNLLSQNNPSYDKNATNDMASAIYNIAINFGEAAGPAFGGFITEKSGFQTSCVYTSFINFVVLIYFIIYNWEIIKIQYGKGQKNNVLSKLELPLIDTEEQNYYSLEKERVGIMLNRSICSLNNFYSLDHIKNSHYKL